MERDFLQEPGQDMNFQLKESRFRSVSYQEIYEKVILIILIDTLSKS